MNQKVYNCKVTGLNRWESEEHKRNGVKNNPDLNENNFTILEIGEKYGVKRYGRKYPFFKKHLE